MIRQAAQANLSSLFPAGQARQAEILATATSMIYTAFMHTCELAALALDCRDPWLWVSHAKLLELRWLVTLCQSSPRSLGLQGSTQLVCPWGRHVHTHRHQCAQGRNSGLMWFWGSIV